MSVIAARVIESTIEIAADSILIKEDIKRTGYKKLYRMLDDFVVGGCGSAEELSLFFEFAKRNKPQAKTIAGIIDYIKLFSEYKQRFTEDSTVNNEYLIIYGGTLYEVDGLFVTEVIDYTAIGQGEAYALSALYLGYDAYTAVDTACELCLNVSKPILTYTIKK